MRPLILLAATALATSAVSPAWAQDHSAHDAPPAEPEVDHATMDHSHGLETAEVGPEPEPPAEESCIVSLEGGELTCGEEPPVDHSAMDHGADGSVRAIGALDHAAMGHAAPAGPIEASGTSRLPQAEGMMPGVHFDLGGGWAGMAHGYAWGVYTDQTGPRGDDMAFVQSMAMLMAERRFEGGRPGPR
jgi:hypothetical protein